MLCKGHGFCGAMGNDALRVAVVDVCRGSLVRGGERDGSNTATCAAVLPVPVWRQSESSSGPLGYCG